MTKLIAFLVVISIVMPSNYTCAETTLPAIDSILIEKKSRSLSIFSKNKKIKTYKIALGFSPVGHKEKSGDGKTPEGNYVISHKNRNSKFHLSLKISYPSPKDIEESRLNKENPGGDIMIHGMKNGFSWIGSFHTVIDWTRGCIAVTNKEIEELYKAIPIGTKIEIIP